MQIRWFPLQYSIVSVKKPCHSDKQLTLARNDMAFGQSEIAQPGSQPCGLLRGKPDDPQKDKHPDRSNGDRKVPLLRFPVRPQITG